MRKTFVAGTFLSLLASGCAIPSPQMDPSAFAEMYLTFKS